MDDMQAQGYAPGEPLYGFNIPQSGHDQNHEDWEDWLRWDPTAEPASPENSTSNSGASSKNDSPLQDPAVLAGGPPFNAYGSNDTLAPPLIMGEDNLDFGLSNTNVALFDFGRPDINPINFGFEPSIPQPLANDFQNTKPTVNHAQWMNMPDQGQTQDVSMSSFDAGQHLVMPTESFQPLNISTQELSPVSTSNTTNHAASVSSSGSPQPVRKKPGRKRKAAAEPESKESQGESQNGDEPPVKKTSHNVIEKRYRNNLNDKIVELRNSVPSLRAMSRPNGEEDHSDDLEGLTPAHKLNKATVMAKATEYIKHLERRNKTMAEEMEALKARLGTVEAAIGRSKSRQISLGDSSQPMRARQTSASSQSPSSSSSAGWQTSLHVPQDARRVSQVPGQQQYSQNHSQPTYARPPQPPVEAQNTQYVNGRGQNGMMGKLMVGSLAGLMVMEGFHDQQPSGQDTSGQALFAAPTQLLKRTFMSAESSSSTSAAGAALPLLKVFLVISALLYLLAPLFTFTTTKKRKSRLNIRLSPAPSLASPVEVRHQAWLTAIQTVWVPKHFLMEVVAVSIKMIKLSVRRLVGSETFTYLTGITKDDEVARIKAWDIAIDAQLAGGDVEVSYYRLLLTLMASGTLPDSPTRLMQKAVHFRVFFWEVANAGYGDLVMFKEFTARVGKIYWDSARSQQKALVEAKGRYHGDEDGDIVLLPDHLARLVELECDDVLTDDIIQRSYNLIFNKPTAHKTTPNNAMDSVIEDHAIRSPLDAVAAWIGNMTIDSALAESLSDDPAATQDAQYLINLATGVAPPASGTHMRTLAAKAVLFDQHRQANIDLAVDALPVSATASSMNLVNHTPASPDVSTALTLAKLVSLSSPSCPSPARLRAGAVLASLRLPPTSFTLLSAVAAFHVLRAFASDKTLAASTKMGLEELACSLRVWVGTSAGRAAGLTQRECGVLVDVCLDLARKFGGWAEEDSGYGSGGEGGKVSLEPRGRNLLPADEVDAV